MGLSLTRIPVLAAYYQPGQSRLDLVQAFTPEDVGAHAGLGAIHACHFLPELAYWLGRAPKYGA